MAQYGARISGPLLDRIDLRIEVPAVSAADLILPPPEEGSAEAAARVATARRLQGERYAARGLSTATTNATCPAMSFFGNHLTCPFRIMFIVSMP